MKDKFLTLCYKGKHLLSPIMGWRSMTWSMRERSELKIQHRNSNWTYGQGKKRPPSVGRSGSGGYEDYHEIQKPWKILRTWDTEGTRRGGTQKFLGDYLRTVTAKQERKYHLLRISVFPVSSSSRWYQLGVLPVMLSDPALNPHLLKRTLSKSGYITQFSRTVVNAFLTTLPAIKKKKKKCCTFSDAERVLSSARERKDCCQEKYQTVLAPAQFGISLSRRLESRSFVGKICYFRSFLKPGPLLQSQKTQTEKTEK